MTRTRRGERGLRPRRGKWGRLGERSASPFSCVVPPASSHHEPPWTSEKRYAAVRSGSCPRQESQERGMNGWKKGKWNWRHPHRDLWSRFLDIRGRGQSWVLRGLRRRYDRGYQERCTQRSTCRMGAYTLTSGGSGCGRGGSGARECSSRTRDSSGK